MINLAKNSLSASGLSMTQAQSVSNLCYQYSREIEAELYSINNAEKTVKIDGITYVETAGKKMPANIKELLLKKAMLHSTQAFLMECIKSKKQLLDEAEAKRFYYDVKEPIPTFIMPELQDLVSEDWGWKQLSRLEYNEYLEMEAYASHIGQFIHKGGKLDTLRKELPDAKSLEWMSIEQGKKIPVMVNLHHKMFDLTNLHGELSALHRHYEQRVNYYKAKVKNLVSDENARISKENADEIAKCEAHNALIKTEWKSAMETYTAEKQKTAQEFNAKKELEVKAIANMRIQIDPRFQDTIDIFLK